MSHKQLVEVCNLQNEIDLLKTNRLPICVNWTTTRYVAETSTVDNTTWLESTPVKIYKQWANGAISLTAPVGTITEWYCSVAWADVEFIVGCESQVLSLTATATPLSVTLWTTLNFTNPVSTLYTTPAVAYVDKVIVDWGDWEYFIGSPWLWWAQTHIPNVSLASGTYQARLYVSTLDWDIFQLATLWYTYNQATNAVVSTWLSTSSTFAYRYIRNLIQRINTTTNTITYQTDTWATTTIGAGNLFYANCKTPQEQTIEELVLSNWQPVYEVVATALVLTENSSQNRIIWAQALWATINTNPTFAGARDVTVYNQYNVTIAFEYTTTNNATFHRVNIPRGWTFSNILKRDDYTNEGTYTAGRIVFAYTAGAVGPVATPNEININWTT